MKPSKFIRVIPDSSGFVGEGCTIDGHNGSDSCYKNHQSGGWAGHAIYQLVGTIGKVEVEGPAKDVPFAVGQRVKTRDGLDARIVDVNYLSDYPILAIVEKLHGRKNEAVSYTAFGSFYGDSCPHKFDLIPNKVSTKTTKCGLIPAQ